MGEKAERWLKTRPHKSYKSAVKLFCTVTGVKDLDTLLDKDDGELRELLRVFQDSLSNRAPATRNAYVSIIKSFLARYDRHIHVKRVRQWNVTDYHTFSKKEIKALVEQGDIREKALFRVLFETGSRISAVLALKVKDVPALLGEGPGEAPYPVYFNQHVTKGNIRYFSFISDGTLKALKDYLEWRRRGSRPPGRGGRPSESVTAESPVFCNLHKPGAPINLDRALRILKRKWRDAGLPAPREGMRVGNHSFRYSFHRQLQIANVNQAAVELLMGHSTNGVTGRYSRGLTEEDLRQMWARANWRLSSDVTVSELKGLRAENEDLRKRLEATESRLNNIQEARRETDSTMNRLFEDPEFRILLKWKLKELG